MSTSPIIPDEIEGLPPGSILKAIPQNQGIEGLPLGAVVRAINQGVPTANPYQQAADRTGYLPNTSMSAGPSKPQEQPSMWQRFLSAAGIPTSQGATTTAVQSMLTPPAAPDATGLLKTEEQVPILGGDFRARADLSKRADNESGAVGTAHRVASFVPFAGPAVVAAQDKADQGDYAGAAGASLNALLAMEGVKGLTRPSAPELPASSLKDVPTRAPAAVVAPKHVEALTSLVDSKAGTVDPHETATAALPTLRETAVRMNVDPSKLTGRDAGQTTLRVAEQAVKDTQNEFNTIRQPYNSVLVDQKPIADAYRNAITPELKANEPKVATALEKQARKFDQPAPLEQVNQFRTRMNNQLNAFEQKGTTAQIMSDVETKASKAAANAARDVEYSTVGRLSSLDPDYIRALKQREGSLIEAKTSLTKEYNKASGDQGEAVSEGVREKLTNIFPSKHGATKSIIKNFVGPKPIDVLNNRIQKMFSDMGAAEPLPEYQQVQPPTSNGTQPPSAPQPQGGVAGPLPASGATPASAASPKAIAAHQRFIENNPGTNVTATPQAFEARGTKAPVPRQWMRHSDADVNLYFNHRFDTLRNEMAGATTPEAQADVQRRMTELDQMQRSPEGFKQAVGMQGVQPPVAPVADGQITQAHVNAENAFYTQARAELGANASPSAVLQRAQALKQTAQANGAQPPSTPVPSTVRPTLTQRVQSQPLPQLQRVQAPVAPAQSPSGASAQSQAASIMLLAKQGQITPAEADSRIQRLVGSGGRRLIRRPSAPE